MMVRALADGDDRHRLEDEDGRDFGWIVRRSIGFRGFGTEMRATRAALDSWVALEASLNREYAGRPKREVRAERLHIVRDESGEWIVDGEIRVARLQRVPDDPSRVPEYAIELQLPSYASEGVTIAAAQVVARAIHPHLTPREPLETGVEATA